MNRALDAVELALEEERLAELLTELGHLTHFVEEFDQVQKARGIGSTEFLTARSNVIIRARAVVAAARKVLPQ